MSHLRLAQEKSQPLSFIEVWKGIENYLKQVEFPWQGGSLQRKRVDLNRLEMLKDLPNGLTKVTPMQYPSESVSIVRFFDP